VFADLCARPLLPLTGLFVVFLLYFLCIFCSFTCILLLLCFVGYYLLAFSLLDALMETFVTKFVLVPLFSIVSD
jgi:hypothetical protein